MPYNYYNVVSHMFDMQRMLDCNNFDTYSFEKETQLLKSVRSVNRFTPLDYQF